MELICPHCAARYRIAADAVPPEGRTIQCAKCGDHWFEPSPADREAIGAGEPVSAEPMIDGGVLGEAVPELGAAAPHVLAIGPAFTDAAPIPLAVTDAQTVATARGLGMVGWVLLLLVLGLIGAGVYAYQTGRLLIP